MKKYYPPKITAAYSFCIYSKQFNIFLEEAIKIIVEKVYGPVDDTGIGYTGLHTNIVTNKL